MSYPKRTYKLEATKGLALDIPASEVGPEFWTLGQNVCFRDGFAQRVGGSRSAYGTLPAAVYHALNVEGDLNWWLFLGTDSVHALEGSHSYDVSPTLTAISSPHEWTSTILNGIPAFTNGKDTPFYWDLASADACTSLPNFPTSTTCKGIVAFKFHLIAYDIDGPDGHFADQILMSAAADPGAVPATWTAAADNDADAATLGDIPGPILTALPLRGSLLIYKRRSVHSLDYVEGTSPWVVRTLLTTIGALTRHSVADIGNGLHLVVSDGDIVVTDGTTTRQIAQGRAKDYLFTALDQANYQELFVVYNRAKQEALICFPSNGGDGTCDTAIIYNTATDDFGIRDLPAGTRWGAVGIVSDTTPDGTWSGASGNWSANTQPWGSVSYSLAAESLLLGYSTTAEMQDSGDAVAMNAYIEKADMPLGDATRVKFVRRVHVRTNGAPGALSVQVGSRMKLGDAVTWSTAQTLSAGDQIVNCFALGRYISLKISSTGSSVWQVTGVDIEYEPRGYY